MLSQLKINNYAIAENLDIEFQSGLSTITGETGAGKSIMIDALSLALGGRADNHVIGNHSDKAQVIATFDIQKNVLAKAWLEEKSLDADGECILRRVLSKDGKSRAFINGMPSPLQDVKSLAELLINIHSQHQHQQLLKKESHRELLDAFCENQAEVKELQHAFKQWKHIQKQLKELFNNQSTRLGRIEFLQFQLEELDKLNLGEHEYQQLNEDYKKLATVDQDLEAANEALALLSEQENFAITDVLYKTQSIFQHLATKHSALAPAAESIANALIEIEESTRDLKNYLENLESDPETLHSIDQRLASIHQIARKHHIKAEQLFEFHQKLHTELRTLLSSDVSLSHLEEQNKKQEQHFFALAQQISKKRKTAAKKLDKAISQKFIELGMADARIETSVQTLENQDAHQFGIDDIEILIATNPNQKPQALSKIASGGELSRISLAIQVNFAEKSNIPCLIFDEVDVGIGGATAEVVGRLLRELAGHGQVICVTHLAQVAAQGNHHLKIQKSHGEHGNTTQVKHLKQKERIEEIARMLGGLELTQKTQSHAKEMLAMASNT